MADKTIIINTDNTEEDQRDDKQLQRANKDQVTGCLHPVIPIDHRAFNVKPKLTDHRSCKESKQDQNGQQVCTSMCHALQAT